MLVKSLLSQVLDSDSLTRGLADPEARILIEWLVEQAERLADTASEQTARCEIKRLCRRARGITRFVVLWCHEGERGAAVQLAAAEGFTWPLPTCTVDPCELMHAILQCEANAFAA